MLNRRNFEVLDTIERSDFVHMKEELGDLLLQVVMHSQIAEENEQFCLEDTIKEISEKLIRRHPHVFGDNQEATDTDSVLSQWEAIKAEEKKKKGQINESVFKDLPPLLPALLYARDLYKQVTKKEAKYLEALPDSTKELTSKKLTEEQAGEQLFAIAAACRANGIDPEAALRRYSMKQQAELEDL